MAKIQERQRGGAALLSTSRLTNILHVAKPYNLDTPHLLIISVYTSCWLVPETRHLLCLFGQYRFSGEKKSSNNGPQLQQLAISGGTNRNEPDHAALGSNLATSLSQRLSLCGSCVLVLAYRAGAVSMADQPAISRSQLMVGNTFKPKIALLKPQDHTRS